MTDQPPKWERCIDAQGRTFYFDKISNKTSWTPPPPDSPPTAPPLSSSESYSMNPYAHQSASYHPQGSYPPSSLAPQSSAPIGSRPPQSGPAYPTTPPLPNHMPYPSHSASYAPQSQGYPSHNPSYPVPSPPYPSQTPSYPSPPPHGSSPNGRPSSHQDPYGPPPVGPHGQPPPGGHGGPYAAYQSQSAYHSQVPYVQPSHDPHGPPPPPPPQPPGGYPSHDPHGQPHGYGPPYGGPSSHDPHAPSGRPPRPSGHHLGAHPPPPPPPPLHGDYGRPPSQGPAGYPPVSPPSHPLPPPMGHGSPPSQPPQPPQGYPSAPGQPSHPPPPPHQPSYQPPPVQHPSHMSQIQSNVSAVTAGMSQMSMGLGPNSKVAPISLEFRAVGLRDRDWIGKSDPILHVLLPKDQALDQTQVSQWKRYASTEIVENSLNPTWVQRVKLRYYFERHQPLRFELVDIDNFKTMQGDFLGFATCTLAEVVRNGVVRIRLRRRNGSNGRGELTVRAHDENPIGKVKLQLSLAGKNLDKKDFMGKSDPYYKLLHVRPGSGGTSLLYKSEEKKNDSNPTWKPHTIMIPAGGTPWTDISLAIEVFDWDKYTPHDLIGETAFSLSDLTRTKSVPIINKKKQAKKGSRYKNSGELLVHRADAAELPSFIAYLQGGLRLDFIVAVDFTASNRPVDNPQSLHYMGDPIHPSQYYQALSAVGTILSPYLSDGYITALGFGAKLPGQGDQACFDFALNGESDARVYGVQGLLDAYGKALQIVTLAGPTNFQPIIQSAVNISRSIPVSQTNQHFAVLLILTDGVITDLSATVDTIIDASHSSPMAVVIVGIGNNTDFRAMERLDGDNFKLRSDRGDKVAKHDIVQFTKYDATKPIEYLAADVLQEVPQRVIEFMTDAGIKPNPPFGQPSPY